MAVTRALGILALALALVPWTASPAAADSETVRYVLPLGVAAGGFVVGGDVGLDGCANPCLLAPGPSAIGNPILAVAGPVTDFTVQINDGQYGQLGATMLCLSSTVDGRCNQGDFWFPSRCGPYYAPGTLSVAEVVVVGLTYRDGAGGTCGATEGYLHVQWS